MENYVVSASPHIRGEMTVQTAMRDVVIALIPAMACGIVYFGFRALFLTVLSVAFCVGFEHLWQKITKKPCTVSDGTAVVTGILLAFNVPVTVPWWVLLVGAFVAIIIAKQFFGGVGNNFMNPALVGRAFLLASWPVLMTRWAAPFSGGFFVSADMVSAATPLGMLKNGSTDALPSVFSMIVGNIGGCIGETSAIAIALGGLYLVLRKVISPRIPVLYILTVGVFAFLFPTGDMANIQSMLYHIFGGGLFLGAVFMATDYVTSPITAKGQWIFAVGCGILTFVIRRFGGYPEGVSYSILLMNAVTPLIDKFTAPRTYGTVKEAHKA